MYLIYTKLQIYWKYKNYFKRNGVSLNLRIFYKLLIYIFSNLKPTSKFKIEALASLI